MLDENWKKNFNVFHELFSVDSKKKFNALINYLKKNICQEIDNNNRLHDAGHVSHEWTSAFAAILNFQMQVNKL